MISFVLLFLQPWKKIRAKAQERKKVAPLRETFHHDLIFMAS
jgi:hypothetical protein